MPLRDLLFLCAIVVPPFTMLHAADVLPPSTLDFAILIPKTLPRSVIYRQDGWHMWDPCVIQTDDGTNHLLYSRWPKSLGFDAWCTHAEIAWASSKSATGPYEFRGTVLPARGIEFWDGHSTFNTCVIRYKQKFYLYYTGNRGTTDNISGRKWSTHRNNQRTGVAVADHPGGPWQRFDKPLLDVGPDYGQGIVSVPNVLVRPDDTLMLFYKTMLPGPGQFGGGVAHFPTTATDPLGPFKRYERQMIDKNILLKTKQKFNFHIDDHFEWYQKDRYYAIVKDHDAPFMSPHGRSLLLFESPDGFDWHPSNHALVKDFSIQWDDGKKENFQRLEMPKILLEKGRPRLLSLAAFNGRDSSLVIIPLNQQAEPQTQRASP